MDKAKPLAVPELGLHAQTRCGPDLSTRAEFLKNLPAVFVALIFLASTGLTAFAPSHIWVDTLFDDAYYYLSIGRNMSMGNGSMFTAPLHTNGYQPLWQMIVAGVAFCVGEDRRLLALMLHLLSALAVVAFFVIAKKQEGKAWPAALTVIAFPAVFMTGMETVLIPPLALLYFRIDGWRRGILGSLIFLARLDAAALLAGRELVQFFRTRTIDIRACAVITATGLAYAGINYNVFGVPVPISGLSKAVGNVIGENWRVGASYVFGSIPMVCAIFFRHLIRSGTVSLYSTDRIYAICFAIMCSIIYYSLFSGWILWAWYYWPAALLFYLLLLEIEHDPRETVRLVRQVVASLAIVMGLIDIYIRLIAPTLISSGIIAHEPSWGMANVAMAQRIAASPAHGATFAMGDRAGSFGYFLPDGTHFVQTEGLVANLDYLKALRAGKGEEFLGRAHVDYLVIDRGQYWVFGSVIGIPEPIQGLSARTGVMFLCFPRTAVVNDFGRQRRERLVFAFADRAPCPSEAITTFRKRQGTYGEIRRTSLWPKRPTGFLGALE